MTLSRYGLLGKDIDYSFSRDYFTEKFECENTHANYVNFDIPSIQDFPNICNSQPFLKGMNVTIPYKEQVKPYLDEIDETAKIIGAVNTIKFVDGKKIGFNTDYYGFMESLKPHLKEHHNKALILGTGGASKAIAYGLKQLGIDYVLVSRNPDFEELPYNAIDEDILNAYTIIVNCTPLGTYPKIEQFPDLPYEALSEKHLLFDLIYNPAETTFLKHGKEQGATIVNGSKMLELQAEESWRIWNS